MRTIIHEIRNHLAVAVANIEAFADGKLEATPERLRGILQVLTELDVLVDDLRPFVPADAETPFARPTSPAPARMREIDICALIANEALSLEAPAREKGLRYEVRRCEHTHPACARFLGDPKRIAEIVQNILLNAVRYTPAGGSVSVDCRRSCAELIFSVGDDGSGITPEEQEAIFAAGVRGSASGGTSGSGLGLALVKRFVEEHGGKVEVQSKPGKGAVFTVALPGTACRDDDPLLPRVV